MAARVALADHGGSGGHAGYFTLRVNGRKRMSRELTTDTCAGSFDRRTSGAAERFEGDVAMIARLCWRNVRAGLVAAPLAVGLIACYSLVGIPSAAATPTTVSDWATLSNDVNGCTTSLTVALGAAITAPANDNLAVPSGCALTLDLAGYDLSITDVGSGEAGIAVPTGASLVIEDTSAAGTLTATGNNGGGNTGFGGGAGIGGNDNGGGFGCGDDLVGHRDRHWRRRQLYR